MGDEKNSPRKGGYIYRLCMSTHHPPTTKPEPTLVGIKTCLEIVFQDKATRPGLRTFNEWKNRGYFPQLKINKSVYLDPVAVRRALTKRFTIDAISA
jgi:hypothetical protein